MSGVESGEHVRAGGRRLAVRRIGRWDRGDPVLVLLHEGLGSISMWRDFPEALSRACGLPLLAYDRPGHGRSGPLDGPRPPDFLELEACETLPALLRETAIERPVLVGHSDGGTIALLFAAAFPATPPACIVLAAHVMLEPRTRAGVAAAARRWREDGDFRRRLSRHHDAPAPMVEEWARVWLSEEKSAWTMVPALSSILCPLLAIQGADDAHGTPAQLDRMAASVGRHAVTALLPDCGHVPHHEARDVVLQRITTFLGEVLGNRRAARRQAGDGAPATARPADVACCQQHRTVS